MQDMYELVDICSSFSAVNPVLLLIVWVLVHDYENDAHKIFVEILIFLLLTAAASLYVPLNTPSRSHTTVVLLMQSLYMVPLQMLRKATEEAPA